MRLLSAPRRLASAAVRHLTRVLLVGTLLSTSSIARADDAPVWAQLTAEQQVALRPLQTRWNKLPDYQRKRLLGAANQYSTLTPTQQARFTNRLSRWSTLTLAEREHARQAYKRYTRLSDAERAELRKQYIKLHPELRIAATQKTPGD